jgi:predicted O-linked N-acetylglucosamine transferase (SPINDLY family)
LPTAPQIFAQAVAYHQSGNLAQAESLYRQTLSIDPTYAEAHGNLGVLLARWGRLEEAVWHYQAALRSKPEYAEAYYNLGNVLRRIGRPADAAACYQQALRYQPGNANMHCNLGLAYVDLHQFDQAIASFREALRRDPQFVEGHHFLANALQRSGRVMEAVASFQEYARLRPNEPRGYNNLGLSLLWAGRAEEAVAALKRAVQLKPDYVEAYNNLGLALEAHGDPDGSVGAFESAVRLAPNFPEAQNNLGNAYTEQGKIDEAIACFRRAIALQPQAAHLHSNLLLTLNYKADLNPADLFQEHLAWARQHLPPEQIALLPQSGASGLGVRSPATPARSAELQFREELPAVNTDPPEPPGLKLRIGYLSADFRQHTVPSFIEPVLAAHNHDKFHIIAYANVNRPDAVTERLKPYFDDWRNLAGVPDEQAATIICDDAVDVLVDLGGHTASNRLLLLARKPAPVQATLFGYPNTTAVPAVDYRISDPLADPPGQTEAFYTEAIFRLPEVAWCYQPGASPEVGPLPALARGLVVPPSGGRDAQPRDALPPEGGTTNRVTFGSFNNLAKVNEQVIALWARVLAAIPGSRLWLMRGRAAQGAARVVDLFARHGIAADRLELIARQPKEAYFQLYNQVDICLDPFPYNGGVTSCDALWMGVPLVALAGRTYVSRQGVSLMTHLGLPEFIAQTPDEYVQIAVRYATDLEALTAIRAGLRARMQRSTLVDAARYTRQLEAAYEQMAARRP